MKVILPTMGVLLALTAIFGTQAETDKVGYMTVGVFLAALAEWVWKLTEFPKEK
jgi:hypothetical protein